MAPESHDRSGGFTLLEVAIALTIMAVSVIATAPLFILAARENAAGGDLGNIGAVTTERLEQLRGTGYHFLPPGGDLNSNVAGYSDTSIPGFVVRWTIANNPNPPAKTKVITVRTLSTRQTIGQTKEITLITVRGE